MRAQRFAMSIIQLFREIIKERWGVQESCTPLHWLVEMWNDMIKSYDINERWLIKKWKYIIVGKIILFYCGTLNKKLGR